MKKKISLLIIVLLSIFSSNVYAASATVGFSGNSTVAANQNITIKMYVSNVTDAVGGIVSVGGNLSFDSEYLEYVSGTGVSSPYQFQINTGANYKIAGLDTTLSNGINSETTVFTFVFKAKKVGSTQITLTDAKLSDTSSKITAAIVPKTITITEASETKSNDATLKSLSVNGYTLSPVFSSNITSYEVTVPNDITSIKINGSVNHSKATVTGLGNITLTGDSTTVEIKVTAEDGTVKKYTLKINKESHDEPVVSEKSSDATLKKLNVSGYTLNPTFNKNTKTYSMKVNNNITGLNVEAIANNDKATVSISGNSGWKVGINTISIKVTAEDGTTNTYVVNVERKSDEENTTKLSSDNYLSSLTINSSHEINPAFNKNISNYEITVPNEITSLDLKTVLSSSKAKLKINGNKDFKIGDNVVELVVTAEDGSSRVYTLNVNRTNTESKNDLIDIIIPGAILSPKFDPSVLEYTTKVDSDVDKLDISATAKDSDSKIEIIGNDNLKEGINTILIKVTDENGFTKYYEIQVEKEENKILGLTPLQFGIIGTIIGLLLITTLVLLFREKRKHLNNETPIIEVKPEFNFSSKNNSDDDVVYGNFKQSQGKSNELKEVEEAPYDLYDDIVTKDELIDAIEEAKLTRDTSKLKMLLEQEALNRKKKELQEKETNQDNDRR